MTVGRIIFVWGCRGSTPSIEGTIRIGVSAPVPGYLMGRGTLMGRGELIGTGDLIGRGSLIGAGGVIGRGPLKGAGGGTGRFGLKKGMATLGAPRSSRWLCCLLCLNLVGEVKYHGYRLSVSKRMVMAHRSACVVSGSVAPTAISVRRVCRSPLAFPPFIRHACCLGARGSNKYPFHGYSCP